MKIYVLVADDNEHNLTFNMPVVFGRGLRAYDSKARAKVYARKFKCKVVELDIKSGKIIADESN